MKNKTQGFENIPSLDNLAGEWLSAEKLAQYPTVHNFHGNLQVNKDLLSVSWLLSVPFVQGQHSGTVHINDKVHCADEFKWYPYQAKRRKTTEDGIKIESTVRMVFEDNGVLFRLKFSNADKVSKKLRLRIDHAGIISKYKSPLDWDWFYRLPDYPEDNGSRNVAWNAILDTEKIRKNIEKPLKKKKNYRATLFEENNLILIKNLTNEAYTTYAFSQTPDNIVSDNSYAHSEWNITLAPGEEKSIDYVMGFGDKESDTLNAVSNWSDNFDNVFEEAKNLWQQRFNDAFSVGNNHFSGSLPILVTDDKKLSRVYYIAIITLLMLHRTNLPVLDRSYLTGSPRLGGTIMFYWDTSMWSTVFALLDPEIMKQCLRNWLKLDIDKYFGQDLLGGRGVGNMYSATRMNIFKMIYTYLNITHDKDFLNEKIFSLSEGTYAEMHGDDNVCLAENIGEITILQQLENLATAWKQHVREGDILADYGEAVNLLECVPTYIHKVPSFNAANVWMMNTTAEFYKSAGNNDKAEQLKHEAAILSKHVLGLYASGEGVWHSLHRDGTRVEMRHCYDFITIGKFMTDYLTDDMKKEMTVFVNNELLTATWMRAQSLKDPAADYSDRADHGPLGAYDAWPAQTADVMGLFGDWNKALEIIQNCEDVTKEGNFSQARELFGPNKHNFDADVRIADRDLVNRECSGGVAFANSVIQYIFGFNPSYNNEDKILLDSETPRGFTGKLLNLKYRNKYCSILSNDKGIQFISE
ncbi:MAG: hypothetical protein GY756_01550 [bacterium]|nr:hypothetical protein [bacterium]